MSRHQPAGIARIYLQLTSLFFVLWLSGCAVFGGTEIQAQKASSYSVIPPRGWVSKDRGEGDYAYRLPSGGMVSLNSSCNRHLDVELEVLTRQLLIGSRNMQFLRSERIKIGGEEGLMTVVNATYEGTPFHLVLFVIKLGKCIFDFSLVNPKAISALEEHAFLEFVRSFHYGKP